MIRYGRNQGRYIVLALIVTADGDEEMAVE
jgi:hypothetical protein